MACKDTVSRQPQVCIYCHSRLGYGLLLPAGIIWYYLYSALCKQTKCQQCATHKLDTGFQICDMCYELQKIKAQSLAVDLLTVKNYNLTLQHTLGRFKHERNLSIAVDEVRRAAGELSARQQQCLDLLSELKSEHIHSQQLYERRLKAESQLAFVMSTLRKLSE